jgi:NADH-quinone oxidoreductase subunit M
MILLWLLIILIIGACLSWLFSRWSDNLCRQTALAALAVDWFLVLLLWVLEAGGYPAARPLIEWRGEWIPQIGVSFHLMADGFSVLLLVLAVLVGFIAVAASWSEVKQRVGFFHFNLLLTIAGIIGVFISLDLFLFYFFWELMLVPMYFLIFLWGKEKRTRAGLIFFLYTQAGGLFMLIAILGLYFAHGQSTGFYSFDYRELLNANIQSPVLAFWLMFGFFIAFAVKLPVVPAHGWLPDAYTEAPTAGSIILSGVMVKTAAYGFLRFLIPLFPAATARFTTAAFILAAVGILYGAALAFAQKDMKRYIAYSSINHVGFILLGAFAWNQLALQGVMIIILAHGLGMSGLFLLAGSLEERLQTRDLDSMGGFWNLAPRMGGIGLFFALAALSLPGLANFVGEFLVLLGAYQVNPTLTIIAASGLVFSATYSLWLVQHIFFGSEPKMRDMPELGLRETVIFGALMAGIVWLGIYPQSFLRTAAPALETIRSERGRKFEQAAPSATASAGNTDTPRVILPAEVVK